MSGGSCFIPTTELKGGDSVEGGVLEGIKQELRQVVIWQGNVKGKISAEALRALAGATLTHIDRLERVVVRLLMVHEGRSRKEAEKLVKIIDYLGE